MGYSRSNAFYRIVNKVRHKLKLIRCQTHDSISLPDSPASFKNQRIFFENSFSSPFQTRNSSESKSQFSKRISDFFSHKSRQELIKLDLTNFLKIYFEFAYWVCLCPFHFIREHSEFGTGYEFTVVSWWPQKVVCAGASFSSLLWFVRDLRLSAPSDPRNPSLHFRLLLKILGLLMKSTTIQRFWMNREEFRNILNFIAAQENCLPVKPIRMLNKHFIRFLCLLYTGMGISNWVSGLGLGSYSDAVYTDDHIANWSGTWWWTSMVNASNYNLFRKSLEKNATSISGMDTFIAIPSAIGFLQMHILSSYCDFLVLMAALTLWTSAYSFSHGLRLTNKCRVINGIKVVCLQNDEKEWVKVYGQFKALKKLTSLVNLAIGSNITFFLLEAILYYATRFDEVFFKEKRHDECEVVRFMFFFCNTIAILLVSADICKQMNSLKVWLSEEENRVKVAGDNLLVALNDVDSHTVAIRGNNIFPITYSLIANMVGTTVTYFIICVQAGNIGRSVEIHHNNYYSISCNNTTSSFSPMHV